MNLLRTRYFGCPKQQGHERGYFVLELFGFAVLLTVVACFPSAPFGGSVSSFVQVARAQEQLEQQQQDSSSSSSLLDFSTPKNDMNVTIIEGETFSINSAIAFPYFRLDATNKEPEDPSLPRQVFLFRNCTFHRPVTIKPNALWHHTNKTSNIIQRVGLFFEDCVFGSYFQFKFQPKLRDVTVRAVNCIFAMSRFIYFSGGSTVISNSYFELRHVGTTYKNHFESLGMMSFVPLSFQTSLVLERITILCYNVTASLHSLVVVTTPHMANSTIIVEKCTTPPKQFMRFPLVKVENVLFGNILNTCRNNTLIVKDNIITFYYARQGVRVIYFALQRFEFVRNNFTTVADAHNLLILKNVIADSFGPPANPGGVLSSLRRIVTLVTSVPQSDTT